jgi:hypothetical protein
MFAITPPAAAAATRFELVCGPLLAANPKPTAMVWTSGPFLLRFIVTLRDASLPNVENAIDFQNAANL